jgi:hypothetical protein
MATAQDRGKLKTHVPATQLHRPRSHLTWLKPAGRSSRVALSCTLPRKRSSIWASLIGWLRCGLRAWDCLQGRARPTSTGPQLPLPLLTPRGSVQCAFLQQPSSLQNTPLVLHFDRKIRPIFLIDNVLLSIQRGGLPRHKILRERLEPRH